MPYYKKTTECVKISYCLVLISTQQNNTLTTVLLNKPKRKLLRAIILEACCSLLHTQMKGIKKIVCRYSETIL